MAGDLSIKPGSALDHRVQFLKRVHIVVLVLRQRLDAGKGRVERGGISDAVAQGVTAQLA